nr:uncharacterized protein LOC109146951 isoform X1 [Ipomoea batatas]
MASSSKKHAKFVSRIASRIYFLVIILQVPLFRFQCGIGTCKTPIEVTLYQLFGSEILPAAMVKPLLYPGAMAKALVNKKPIPSYDNLLHIHNFINSKQTLPTLGLNHLEILAGSYLCVAGAVLGVIKKSGRLSLFGLLLIIWGVKKQEIFGKDASRSVLIFPTMFVALVSAFFSIRKDVRKLFRTLGIFSKRKHKYT